MTETQKTYEFDQRVETYGRIADFIESAINPLIEDNFRNYSSTLFKTDEQAFENLLASDTQVREIAEMLKTHFSRRDLKFYYDDLLTQESNPGKLALHGVFFVGLPICISAAALVYLDYRYPVFFGGIIGFFTLLTLWMPFAIGKHCYGQRVIKLAFALNEIENEDSEIIISKQEKNEFYAHEKN